MAFRFMAGISRLVSVANRPAALRMQALRETDPDSERTDFFGLKRGSHLRRLLFLFFFCRVKVRN